MRFFKIFLPILLIVLLSYFAIKPFFLSGFFPIHDDTQVARVFEMHKSLTDGMFPVRWVTDLGYNYGYPIFNFYAPLAYYIGALFMFVGFDALMATKTMMALGIILAGIFMYLLAKEFWGRVGGLISASLYLYAPYHALDIYVRGDVAEFWAYAFIPLVFLAVYRIFRYSNEDYIEQEKSNIKNQISKIILKIKKDLWIWVSIGAISYAAVIISHNLTAMMITPFLFAFILLLLLVSRKKFSFILYTLYFILFALSLSGFYWLPVFAEMKYTNVLSQVGGGADYKDHFVCVMQLWDSPWGFGGSTPTCIDGLSFKIGKLHILLFIASLFSLFVLRKKDPTDRSRQDFFWISIFAFFSILIGIFLMLNYSQFIWDALPQMAFIQYPWRFLLIISFLISFLGGSILMCLPRTNLVWVRWVISGGIIVAIIYLNAEVFMPQAVIKKTSNDYVNSFALQWTTSRISDEYMPKNFYKPQSSQEVPLEKFTSNSDVKIMTVTEKTNRIYAEVKVKKKTDILVNLAYFPAWHVFIDEKETKSKNSEGKLAFNVPSGKHNIEVKFIQTPVEKFANYLSLAGILILIFGIISVIKSSSRKSSSQKHFMT